MLVQAEDYLSPAYTPQKRPVLHLHTVPAPALHTLPETRPVNITEEAFKSLLANNP